MECGVESEGALLKAEETSRGENLKRLSGLRSSGTKSGVFKRDC